jgi:hypothetical protein
MLSECNLATESKSWLAAPVIWSRLSTGRMCWLSFNLGLLIAACRGAVVLGDVTLGHHSSVWCNAVLRGDLNRIVVGHHTN